MEWILASASPRRKQLLGELIDNFTVIPSSADENVRASSPRALVKMLSEKKALEVATRVGNEGKTVVGSDTVVALGGKVLGKPKDEQEAFVMLSALSGRAHAVYTGVCLMQVSAQGIRKYTKADKTKVYFYELSSAWIWEYIRGGSPMDKAGGYGIQDGGLVEKFRGSYTNVVGFPQELVKKMIRKVEEAWK